MNHLGHESRAVYAAYAGGAQVAVLPLEYYEQERAQKIIAFADGQRALKSENAATASSESQGADLKQA